MREDRSRGGWFALAKEGASLNAENVRFRAMALGLALLALLAQWPLYDRALVPMDEGHLAAAAGWMLQGKLLYRDIHTGIFPGIYLLTSGLFALFGHDFVVTRLAAVAMNVCITLCLWLVSRRMLRPHWALLPSILYLCLLAVAFPVLSMFNYSTLAVCFGLLGLLFALRYMENGHFADGLLLGLFVACAGLTKQNFGGLIFFALLTAFLVDRSSSVLADRPLSRVFAPIIASGASLTFVVVAGFALQGTLGDLIDSTILSLGESQLKDFNNPIPPIFGAHPQEDGRFIFLYSPPALFNYLVKGESFAGMSITPLFRSLAIRLSYGIPILTLMAAPLVLWRLRGPATAEEDRVARAVVIFAVVFAPGIFPSAIWSHLAFVMIPTLPLVALVGDRIERALEVRGDAHASSLLRGWQVVVGALALLSALCTLQISRDVARWNSVPLELDRARLHVTERQAELFQGAVQFLDACAPEGAPIFVAPDMPALYFLTDRLNPSPYDLTIPGNVDGGLIMRRLEETRTRCIVFSPQMYPEFPPFARLFPRLAVYLNGRYALQEEIRGGETVWWGLVRRPERTGGSEAGRVSADEEPSAGEEPSADDEEPSADDQEPSADDQESKRAPGTGMTERSRSPSL
jgi:hypothetical protein